MMRIACTLLVICITATVAMPPALLPEAPNASIQQAESEVLQATHGGKLNIPQDNEGGAAPATTKEVDSSVQVEPQSSVADPVIVDKVASPQLEPVPPQGSTIQAQIDPPASMIVKKNFHNANRQAVPDDITLTIQSDIGRLERAAVHARQWKGPISYALLIHPDEQGKVENYLSSAPSEVKERVSFHLCITEDDFDHYPINKMRNNAIEGANSEWVYVLDIDEYTVGSMDYHQKVLAETRMEDPGTQKPAYVVMAWQWSAGKKDAPKSKDQLRELYKQGSVGVKSPHFEPAYSAPGLAMNDWLEMQGARHVRFQDAYEPYYITRKSGLPQFDQRFIGWGRNKAIQTLTMAAEGYSWVVLPHVYNFSDEQPGGGHAGLADPEFCKQAFKEMGEQHGCSRCGEFDCVKNCPSLFNSAPYL